MKNTLLVVLFLMVGFGGYYVGHRTEQSLRWLKVGDNVCAADGSGCWVPTQELSTMEIPSQR